MNVRMIIGLLLIMAWAGFAVAAQTGDVTSNCEGRARPMHTLGNGETARHSSAGQGCTRSPNAAHVAATVHDTLSGKAGAGAVQRAVSAVMGWSAVSARGVIVRGRRAYVEDLEPAAVAEEVRAVERELAGESAFEEQSPLGVLHYMNVSGEGPAPLQVHAPVPDDVGEVGVYRRVDRGVFLKMGAAPIRRPRHVGFRVSFPGRFVVREEKTAGTPRDKGLLPAAAPPSRAPAARGHWRFYRVGPEEITGEVPIILVHGAENDRWGDFTHWARFSDEAATLRRCFQLWNFTQNMRGVNAPIGFDRTRPAFEHSIVAALEGFICKASAAGVWSGGQRYVFPEGPFAMVAHSQGALKARAFLVNHPERARDCIAVATIAGTHVGTPWATPEWTRHTFARLGFTPLHIIDRVVDALYRNHWFSLDRQSNLDTAWANYDGEGGFGMPFVEYRTWTGTHGAHTRILSPRDSSREFARSWPAFAADTTFDPPQRLPNYCGGIDHIAPSFRGDKQLDKFFLYGTYIEPGGRLLELVRESGAGTRPAMSNFAENLAMGVTSWLGRFILSKGGDWPMGPYQLGDGVVPLQSQLLLDGRETRPIFKTRRLLGWETPVRPITPDRDIIDAHTLANPDRIRILPEWSHLDTVTGRYNADTGHSTLFSMVAADLLSVLPD